MRVPCAIDILSERRRSLQGLVDLRLETIPLVEVEDEDILVEDNNEEKHKYLLFKTPSG